MNRTFIPFCIVVHIAPSEVAVTRQSWGSSNYIEFIYDESSQPFAMRYNGTLYYYVLNIQGDVVGLLNTSGTMVATYTYDPWGKVISNVESGSLADVNPLRYRGYYYDSETGFYYLQSRYYDPAIGRFINADSYATTDATNARSSNMFAYCENDPVNRSDPTGELFVQAALVGALVGMGRQLVMDVAYNLVAGCPLDELSPLGTYASAAFSGALSAVSGGGALMTAVNIVGSAIISEAVDSACSNEKFDVGNVASDVISSAIQTRVANGIGSKAPTKISDIKAEAKAQGAHGANDLRAYLKNKQQAYSSAVELFNNAFDTVRNFIEREKRK